MVFDTARQLAHELKSSEEYAAFRAARERAEANDSTRALLHEYGRLQLVAQAASVAGRKDEETMQRLQKLGELLQFDADAAAYLLAEYRLKGMLGTVYKLLAEAVDVDLDALES